MCSDFAKKCTDFGENIPFLTLFGLKSQLKNSCNCVLEEKHQKFSLLPLYMYMERLSKYPYFKKAPLSQKIPCCVPVNYTYPKCYLDCIFFLSNIFRQEQK